MLLLLNLNFQAYFILQIFITCKINKINPYLLGIVWFYSICTRKKSNFNQ